ncbi:hypothetical protein AB4254_11530 [Vibrio breoganii]
MKVFREQLVSTEVDRVCDVCDKSVSVEFNGIKTQEFGELKAEFGVGSNGQDGKAYHIDLCEACFMMTVAAVKGQRRSQSMFDDDMALPGDNFGLDVTRDREL